MTPPASGPKPRIEETKPESGGPRIVPITTALLISIAISATGFYWLRRRRCARTGIRARATSTSLPSGPTEENNREQDNAGMATEGSHPARGALIASTLSELDSNQLLEVRRREILGECRINVLQRIDLLLATTGPDPLGPSSSDAFTGGSDNTPDEYRFVTLPGQPTSERLGPEEEGAADARSNRTAAPSVTDLAGSVPTLLSVRHLVDDTFGVGMFRLLSQAALEDVAACLDQNRLLDAAFSAAHYLALGHDPNWSRSKHDRMVEAKRASIEDHHRTGKLRMAASACASLRLLQPGTITGDVSMYTSVLRSDLQDRLSHHKIDIRTTGTAADLYLLSGQWLPDEQDSHRLIDVADSAARSQSNNDLIIEAARVALWLLATLASTNSTAGGQPR